MWEWQINWHVSLKRMSRMRKCPFINVLDKLKLHNKNQQEPASSEPATYEGFSRGGGGNTGSSSTVTLSKDEFPSSKLSLQNSGGCRRERSRTSV